MKKSELKTGMIVTLRNGEKGMVFKDVCTSYTENKQKYSDVIVGVTEDGNFTWETLELYREELLTRDDEYDWMDIMKVEAIDHPNDLVKPFNEIESVKTIFNREPDEEARFKEWLENEYAKHFIINKSKVKSINELIYAIRMSDKDFCLNVLDEYNTCLCIPSAKETFISVRYLEKKIIDIEYDAEDPDYPIVVVRI